MMKNYLIFLLIFVFSLIQGTFGGPNLILLLILFWAGFHSPKEVFWLAFLSGLLLDLATGSPIGFSSFFLLLSSYFLLLLSRRFDTNHPVFFGLFTLAASGFWSYAIWRFFDFRQALILALLAFIVRLKK